VAAELRAGGSRAGAAELGKTPYIRTVVLNDPRRADLLLSDLDRGEAEVIALAQEVRADLVIIDERLGRRHARRLGLRVTGVLGILLRGKQLGHLSAVRPYLDQIQQGGFYLSEALAQHALRLAGEIE
jgi:predicted nucleic acid-binding protein